jgi:hypothetical protein
MNDCGAPATSECSTSFQSSPTVLSTMAQPWSSGSIGLGGQQNAVGALPYRHLADVADEDAAVAGTAGGNVHLSQILMSGGANEAQVLRNLFAEVMIGYADA